MCRWLAYTGEALRPSTVILDAQHSLVAQSLNSPLGAETVNGDGFGFGWYPEDGDPGSAPAFFHSIEPAWNDQNLRELTQSIRSRLFFSHVRAAAGPPIQQSNCHPFRHGRWMFMHNGFLAGFAAMKRDLTFAVDPSLYPEILGTTDSEVLFHLALTLGLEDDPIAALGAAIRLVEEVGRAHGVPFAMQGTVAVSDGVTVWAFRYSSQGRTRSLFHSADVDILREMYPDAERLALFGRHAHLIVSEPLNDLPGVFLEVPESTVAVVDASGYHHRPFTAAGA
ncbi:class II glutamine amidotransferase [Herbiconiux sp. VKM Ac-2851]|uniref:class II glutamine amidotransferase n=1 Tax=Herbiconiux sp. VKM Ac-2851 TaxID=2739025 RepID=UPI0015632AEB|nr:class II glutamine amidotransferase [Herbiconiux sp. VKM Ac-2851]NQX36932.1 class II glutamine amidotransferase [Herbiconiux sp. VKM Ac-2851]